MPSPRAALCAALVLLCTGAVAQPTSSRPPSGVPKSAPPPVASKDLFEVQDTATQQSARAVVAFVCSSRLAPKGDGTYTLAISPFVPPPSSASQNVCADEPFRNQPVAAICSGVLVTSTVVATSAPCLKLVQTACGGQFAGAQTKVRAVFGLEMHSASAPPLVIPGADIATPKRIIKQTTGLTSNWALVELDRAITGRAMPLSTAKSSGGPVRVISHPQGLPTKVSDPVLLDNVAVPSFTVSTSTVGYDSGAPAFNLTGSLNVAGLVVNDPVSWTCSSSTACCKTTPVPGHGTSATLVRGSALASAVCTPNTLCGIECIDTSTDSNNCGKCDNVCALPNTTSTCQAGSCRVGTCTAGYGNCDQVSANGCETPLNTLTNCGACGSVCNLPHADEACNAGICQVSTCESGYANCDGSNANGCEAQLGTITHCSSCTDTCAVLPNTVASCNGTCQYACKAGYSDCDASPGCETKGACTQACTPQSCNDGNPCTQDDCDAAGACTHSPIIAGSPCGIGAVCNSSGLCFPGCWIGGTYYAPNTPDPSRACQECNPNVSTNAWSNKPVGSACNDGDSCTVDDFCTSSGQCSPGVQTCRVIARIRVYGSEVPGGGSGLFGWHLIKSNGADMGSISSGMEKNLFNSIDWSVALNSAIPPNGYFALAGAEGSGPLSRIFEFYDSNNGLIGTTTVTIDVSNNNGSANIVRSFGSANDQFTRFYFDGYAVTPEQVTTSQ